MPNPSVHRTAAAESDCEILVTAPPRPVTCLFGRMDSRRRVRAMHPHVIAGRWFTTALGVGAFLVVLPVRAEPPKPAPAGVPVVKTWGELRRAPLVEVWPGLSVRLGIEAAECPVAHGVFLYCLADGYAPPAPWSEEDRLGPL